MPLPHGPALHLSTTQGLGGERTLNGGGCRLPEASGCPRTPPAWVTLTVAVQWGGGGGQSVSDWLPPGPWLAFVWAPASTPNSPPWFRSVALCCTFKVLSKGGGRQTGQGRLPAHCDGGRARAENTQSARN